MEEGRKLRILFWGTPDFGIPSLEAMRNAGHELVSVVTGPDRPAGRGRLVTESPVKKWALDAGIPVLQPIRPEGKAFVDAIRLLTPDISVVAAYGQILGEVVLNLPELGSLNVHASLLPKLRGAAPINWAIIRGDEQSGVTIMRMVRELDAGPIVAQERILISNETTAGELYIETACRGANLLIKVLSDVGVGRTEESDQKGELATYAPKLDRESARINWTLSAKELHCWLRGCDPWPAAWTELNGVPIQFFGPQVQADQSGNAPGTVLEADPQYGLIVATGSGALRVGEVKPAGRRRMKSEAWVRGAGSIEGASFV